MKIIHTADLHLASPFSYLPKEKRKIKNVYLSQNFENLIKYAKKNNINNIILSGDIFDSNRPSLNIKSFFYNQIEAHPSITFYYLKGNHDIEASLNVELNNLKTFKEIWTTYEIDNVTITGIEINGDIEDYIYKSLTLNANKFNIVMMHGQIINSASSNKKLISLPKLKDKNIDYLALGHIHKYSEMALDEKGIAIYPGCLEGRGFDELGPKGFVVIDTETKKYNFHQLTNREVIEQEINLSDTTSEVAALKKIKNEINLIDKDNIFRLILKGDINYNYDNLKERLHSLYSNKFFYFETKIFLHEKIDIENLKKGVSLKSEFFKIVDEDKNTSKEDKEEIYNLAMNLFNGEEIN